MISGVKLKGNISGPSLFIQRPARLKKCPSVQVVQIPKYLFFSFDLANSKMSGDPFVAGSLGVADYVVFALMLVVSAAVGFYFAWTSRIAGNSREFLTGGRRLTALPVSLSLTANFMSSITVLSNPAEVKMFPFYSCLL